jgi:hypothetical protein
MRKATVPFLAVLLCVAGLAAGAFAQSDKGVIELVARITPTAARPEPVRQFTFYLLTRSYGEVATDVGTAHEIPPRDEFIDGLKVSPELKTWLKAHEVLDLAMPGLDKSVKPEDVTKVPEFLLAYQHSNSGGVTDGMPKPKYKDGDKELHPDKFKKEHEEYLAALKKFIQQHPETINGMELELDAVNPQRKWDKMMSERRSVIARLAPSVAQTKYLVAQVDTDLDGRAVLSGVPPGNYWISTLNLDANAGDARLRWDVPVSVAAGHTTRIELTNLNATDNHTASAP